MDALLGSIDAAVGRAASSFTLQDPSASVAPLADGLRLTREVIARSAGEPDALFALRIKEEQFEDAINAALGLDLSAVAQPSADPPPAGGRGGRGGGFGGAPTMTAPVPGQTFGVTVRLANRGGVPIQLAGSGDSVRIQTTSGWTATPAQPISTMLGPVPAPGSGGRASGPPVLSRGQAVSGFFSVHIADDAPISTKPYFTRPAFTVNHYTLSDPSWFGRPFNPPPLVAVASYSVNGVPVERTTVVTRQEPNLPYGNVTREVRTVPRVGVTVSPTTAVIPLASPTHTAELDVALVHNGADPTSGQVALTLPAGWKSSPAQQPFAFERPGERTTYHFTVTASAIDTRLHDVVAVATANGRSYREGYELIEPRDLEARYLYQPSTTQVRGVDVKLVPNLKVGYVMGIGDQVPTGLRQLGAQVTLLGERDLASADLSAFDAIVTGTRAYLVRDDLKTYNKRLLDYVKAGGNMIVLYNTFEFVPDQFAPYPGELLPSAEEVSEEDSPITILAPTQQSFTWPNKITPADFDGWVEQRGSKFWSKWDPAYTPMISTFDKGQTPQSGGWLTARYGSGTWTYFGYAMHRQLPYGVPGMVRITANLLALGKRPN